MEEMGVIPLLEERESVEDRVAQTLRELIVSGRLPGGTPLVHRELAQRLGVSPTPVRISLTHLEREGLVEVGPTGRAAVTRLSREDFEEIYAARAGLEGLAARVGAVALTDDDIKAMRRLLTGLRRLAREQDVDAYLAKRWELYATCYRASGRRRLVDEVERLFVRSERYNRLVLSTADRFRESVARYAAFLAGLRVPRPGRRRARRPGQHPLGCRSRRAAASVRERAGVSAGDLRAALVDALRDERRVSDGDSERDLHASDMTFHRPHRPDVVVYPQTTEEVAAVLALAHERRVPVTPFGAGSSLEGHVIPVAGGISLDLTRMDRIVEISPDDLTATVQAGVTRTALERAAAEHGLMFPVDPGADATLGGMAATNAAGTTTVRYGKMRANVLALEAVLPGGRVVRAGSRAPKTSAGYDLLGLLIGSEGTLGVITELTVRLHGIPEQAVVLRLSFPDVEAACRAATTIVAAGAGVTRVELLDAWTITAINAHHGLDLPVGASLFVEAAGSEGTVMSDLELVTQIAESEGSLAVVAERDPTARTRLWAARHASAYATAAAAPGPAPSLDRHLRPALRAGRRRLVRAAGARTTRPRRRPGGTRGRRQRPPLADGRPGRPRRGRLVRRADRAARDGCARPRRHLHRRARDRARQGARARA